MTANHIAVDAAVKIVVASQVFRIRSIAGFPGPPSLVQENDLPLQAPISDREPAEIYARTESLT